jgi:hypothetical protein
MTDFYGISRRQLSLIGWILDPGPIASIDPNDPFNLIVWTAASLHDRIMVEIADDGGRRSGRRINLADGEAEDLSAALLKLSDDEAGEVVKAAHDINDLTDKVPDD